MVLKVLKMAKVEKVEDLYIWKKARILCKELFELSSRGTFVKDYVLV